MAGFVDIPKFEDYRNKVKRHRFRKFPVLSLKGKTTIAVHHSLTKQGRSGSNAEGYARYHVDTHGWPSIGYSYVIEPDGTVKFCNDIELRTYHVGDHNNYAVGICLTGDFRTEEPTDAQKESLRNLVGALESKYSHIKHVKGHNEFSGYEWKACPEFNFRKVLDGKGTAVKPKSLPNEYVIQQGDTLWSIAKGRNDVSVNDLEKVNPGIDAKALEQGSTIKLSGAKTESKPKDEYKGKSIVDYLNHVGRDSSYGNRRNLAKKFGISDFRGKPEQNLELLERLQGEDSNAGTGLPDEVYRVEEPLIHGKGVRAVQEALVSMYFYPNKDAKDNGVDSYYGPNTSDAIERFQSIHLPNEVDGVYGPNTKAALEN